MSGALGGMAGFNLIARVRETFSTVGTRLTRQIAGVILVSVFFVNLTLLWPAFMGKRNDLIEHLDHEIGTVVRAAVWPHLDQAGTGDIQAAAHAISETRFTSRLMGGIVYDANGNVVLRFGESMYHSTSELRGERIDVPGERLELYWDSSHMNAPVAIAARLDTSWLPPQTSRHLWGALGVAVLLSCLACMVVTIVIGHMVMGPLQELRASLVAAGKDSTHADAFAPPRRRTGVLGDLSRIIQQLLQRVSQTFREELATFAAMINQTGDGVFAYDHEGNLVYANKAFLEYCQVSGVNELRSLGGPRFCLPDDKTEFSLLDLLNDGKYDGEVDLVFREIEPIRCLISASCLSTEDGRVLRSFATLSNISDIRAAQWAVEQKNTELEEANRIKSEFLAQMSHELRTPLNAIIGFSEILTCRPDAEDHGDVRDFATDINNSGHHLLGLINDILDLSKLEAGKHELSESVVDLLDLADSSVTMLREAANKNQITLQQKLPAHALEISCDAIRIKQVLLNLLSNAIKFTDKGGTVTLDIGIEKNLVTVSVSDTGIGMREEDIPKALQPFAQIDSGFSRRFDGTGLGLPISAELIKVHGGEMTIASAPDEGTKVTFTLPASRIVSVAA